MTEPEPQSMSVTIAGSGGGTIELSQRILGMQPYVLLEWNEDAQMFDIDAGGGVPDLDAVGMVLRTVSEILDEGSVDSPADADE